MRTKIQRKRKRRWGERSATACPASCWRSPIGNDASWWGWVFQNAIISSVSVFWKAYTHVKRRFPFEGESSPGLTEHLSHAQYLVCVCERLSLKGCFNQLRKMSLNITRHIFECQYVHQGIWCIEILLIQTCQNQSENIVIQESFCCLVVIVVVVNMKFHLQWWSR